MKKTLLLSFVMLGALLGFTSCSDSDHDEARVLAGEWQGDWGMWYQDEDGYYFYADYTYIRLIPDHYDATHGYGYQEDYYSWDDTRSVMSYYRYLWYRFDWQVSNGRIYITYPSNPDLDAYIRDYRLSLDYFSGYFDDSNDRFRLVKLSDFYDWTPTVVVSTYYGYSIYSGYSPKYQGQANSKQLQPATRHYENAPSIIRQGNRLNRPK